MVEKPISINAIKKEPFTGSETGMRYRFEKVEDLLKTSVYPEPFAFDKTDPEKITTKDFEFSNDGYDQAIAWINEEFEKARK